MSSLMYPILAATQGDLAIAQTPNEAIESRIRLFLDVAPTERPMLPKFGSKVQPYVPAEYDGLQAESLRLDLNQWCRDDGELIEYQVSTLELGQQDLGQSRLRVSYAIGQLDSI